MPHALISSDGCEPHATASLTFLPSVYQPSYICLGINYLQPAVIPRGGCRAKLLKVVAFTLFSKG